ncbi:amino acid permease/ SLC12A domain-containing protein [Spinellus fusiger]|nr:amino acid permease/ SLC12A domain-containing protein [Spinellus fusiger]
MFRKQQDNIEAGANEITYTTYESEKTEINFHENDSSTSQEHREENNVKRSMSVRHIQMISLAGTIGTGLFLTSGQNIAAAGPAGALIAYCVVGFMVFCIMTCLGEMATFMPVSGSFYHYATRFVDPSFGFALGWTCWFSSVTIAAEVAAAANIIEYWKIVMPAPAWSTIFMVLLFSINIVGVRIYGEMEYWIALVKILIIIVFIVIAICVTAGGLGGHVIGFSYWSSPGAFANGAVGTVSVFLTGGFSFQGAEIIGITAGEVKNPTKAVPRAIRNTFWRILIFYIATIFLLGMCIPSDYPALTNEDGVTTASFTIVFNLAGIEAGSHVINAIILTSVLSAANSCLYTSSRILLGLSQDGNAPAFFGRINRYGSPYIAVIFSSIIGFVCIFVSIYSASVTFLWFLNITAVSGFIIWAGIAIVHLRFRKAYTHQGRSLSDLPYISFAYPFSGLFASILSILIILGQGYTAFMPFDGVNFVTSYIGIVPFFLCYIIHKIVRRTKVVPLDEVDLDTNRVTKQDREIDEIEERKRTILQRIIDIFA